MAMPWSGRFAVTCRLARRVAGAAGVMLLAGCAVGPDYEPPDSSVPASWPQVDTQLPGTSSVPAFEPIEIIRWWTSFNDPMLTSLVERAVLENLDLRAAQSRVRQARAARGVTGSAFWPGVQAGADYRRSRPSEGMGGSGQQSDLFQAGLDAAWELDIFGGTRRGIEAADADIRAAVEDRRDVLVTLVSEVALNYIDLRTFQERLAIARRNLEAQQHTADLTRRRLGSGFASALDVAQAEADVATTRSTIPALEASIRQAIYSLSVLLGREPNALEQELSVVKPMPPVPPRVPVGLPSDLLQRRPDIRRAEASLHAATARIGVATADLFPKLSLLGSAGLQSDKLSTWGNWSSRFWSVGPSATWEIFAAGRIRSTIEVQNALEEQALLAYEKTILTALQDVESAMEAYVREQQRVHALAEAVAANRKALKLSTQLYTEGLTDFLNVLTAQRSLYITEEAITQSQGNVSANLIALYKALGGGWEDEP
jgi:outer membrane protein, multidrug efflux system